HVAALRTVRRSHGLREPALLRDGLRTLRTRAGGTSREAHGRDRALGDAKPACGHALRRLEAAAGLGVRHRARTGDALSRRAPRRRRSRRPPGVLEVDLRTVERGHDDPRDHALHGRSGALPAARVPLARTSDRSRHCHGDPRAVQPADDRGRVHRAAASRRGRGGVSLIARIRGARFWPMLWKEFIQMRRDRLTLAVMTGLPAIQLVLFGYAIQTDVRHLRTVVLDESRTPESRALVAVMINTGNFH